MMKTNSFMETQCRNMIDAVSTFSTACDLAALEDDGAVSREEEKALRRIRKAALRFQAELRRVAG